MKKKADIPTPIEAHADLLSKHIIDEIIYAFGGKRNGWMQKIATPFLRIPTRHFGRIAADFYDQVTRLGVSQGATAALPQFNHQVIARGAERIPPKGPLLLVSNHPGGLDSLGLISCLPRNDLKILVTDVQFMHLLDNQNRYFYYVSFESIGGMVALRGAIEHVRAGGALLLFAHGEVEPEPEYFPAAMDEITNWSPSVEIILRKVPDASLQIMTVSGVVLPRFLNSPIVRLRSDAARRQKLAEFIQVLQSLILKKSQPVQIHITVGNPMKSDALGTDRYMDEIIRRAQEQMDDHLKWLTTPGSVI